MCDTVSCSHTYIVNINTNKLKCFNVLFICRNSDFCKCFVMTRLTKDYVRDVFHVLLFICN